MKLRCRICDFSETLPSIYQSGLTDNPRRLKSVDGEVVCDVCLDVINDTVTEDQIAEEDFLIEP